MSIRLKGGRSCGSDLQQTKTSKTRKQKAKTPGSISSNNAPIQTLETRETETATESLAAGLEATLAIVSIIVIEATVTVITLEESVRSKSLSLRSIDLREGEQGDVAQLLTTLRNRPILRSRRKLVLVEQAGPTRRTQSYLLMTVKRGLKSMSIS